METPRRSTPSIQSICIALIALGAVVLGWSWFLSPRHRPIERSPVSPEQLAELAGFGAAEGYNLLVITIDTVRVDRLGCYGYVRAKTPHMDALTEPGIQFLHAIAPAPITLPSHSTIMTGLDVPSHGARDNGSFVLHDDRLTLAEVLRDQGYATMAAIGAYVLDSRYGLAQGFESYDQRMGEASSSGLHFNERTANAVTDAALAWFGNREAGDPRPFFSWVHYFDAHGEYQPPSPYREQLADPYDGEIAFVDAEIGRLLANLRQRGLLEKTLIVLAADHGEGLGDHGEQTHSRLIYDTTLHVPLILSCPGIVDRRITVEDRIVSLADIFPTVLDLLGVAREARVDGINMLTTGPDPTRALYIESMAPLLNNGWASLHGLHRLHDKFILAPQSEYYDLRTDPGELENLYERNPDELSALIAALDARMRQWDLPERVMAEANQLDAEQLRRLAALGYVRADALAENVGQIDPKDALPAWQDMLKAEALSGQGETEEAISMIEQVLEQMPHDAQAWSVAGLVYLRAEDPEEAIRCLERSIDLRPTAHRYIRLAQLLIQNQAFEEADAALAEAEQLDPLHGELYTTRGDRLAITGNFEAALEQFERALEVDPVRVGELARKKIALAKQRLGQ